MKDCKLNQLLHLDSVHTGTVTPLDVERPKAKRKTVTAAHIVAALGKMREKCNENRSGPHPCEDCPMISRDGFGCIDFGACSNVALHDQQIARQIFRHIEEE